MDDRRHLSDHPAQRGPPLLVEEEGRIGAVFALEDDAVRVIVNPFHGDHAEDGVSISELLENGFLDKGGITAGILLRNDMDTDDALTCYEKHKAHSPTFIHAGFTEAKALAEKLGSFLGQLTEAPIKGILDTEMVETYVVGTGYGRARLPFSKEHIRSEILCHGLGAHVMYPNTATVLDIGGQDTKAIQIDPAGIVESFQMNDRCAAGCGRYLGYIADEMNMGLHELGPMAMKSTKTIRINSTCTVFAGAELRDRLSLGDKREDIMAGLHRAIILRAMSILARSGGIRDEFTFTGGVAKNEAAVKALKELVRENYGEVTLNINPDSIYTGALGGATFAWRAVVEEGKTVEARA